MVEQVCPLPATQYQPVPTDDLFIDYSGTPAYVDSNSPLSSSRVLSRLPGRSRVASSPDHPRPGSTAELMRQQQGLGEV